MELLENLAIRICKSKKLRWAICNLRFRALGSRLERDEEANAQDPELGLKRSDTARSRLSKAAHDPTILRVGTGLNGRCSECTEIARFLRCSIAIAIVDSRNRTRFRRQDNAMPQCDSGCDGKHRWQLRFRVAMSEPNLFLSLFGIVASWLWRC